jgi:hypothetical protein
MPLNNYQNLLAKQSIQELPNIDPGLQNESLELFHSRISKLVESILSNTSIGSQEQELKLNRLCDSILKKAKNSFNVNKNNFVEPFIIQSLSQKYRQTLTQRFEEQYEDSNRSDISIDEYVGKKLQDKLMEKKQNQQYRLKSWCDYILNENISFPSWYRYLVLRSIVTFTDRDTKSQNRKRSNETAENYLKLNNQILPIVFTQIQEEDREVMKFFELYKNELRLKIETVNDLEIIPQEEFYKGEWQIFSQINGDQSFEELDGSQKEIVIRLNSLAENSPWCLNEPNTALDYLKMGEVRVYTVRDIPMLAINFENDDEEPTLREVRGGEVGEKIHKKMLPVMQSIYSSIESEGCYIPKARYEEVEDRLKGIAIEEGKKRVFDAVERAIESDSVADLEIEVIKSYFDLYFTEDEDINDEENSSFYISSEMEHTMKMLALRYTSEVLGVQCRLEQIILPHAGRKNEQLVSLLEVPTQAKVCFMSGNYDGNQDNRNNMHLDCWNFEWINELCISHYQDSMQDFIVKDEFSVDIEYDEYGNVREDDAPDNHFPNLRYAGTLKTEHVSLTFPELNEIGSLQINNSKIIAPKLRRIEYLYVHSNGNNLLEIGSSDTPIEITNLKFDASAFINSSVFLNKIDKSKVETLIINLLNIKLLSDPSFFDKFYLDGFDNSKVLFEDESGRKSYTLEQVRSRMDFKVKLNSLRPDFTADEAKYLLGLKKLVHPYSDFKEEMAECLVREQKFPTAFKALIAKAFEGNQNIATGLKEINKSTEVIYGIDPNFLLNSDEVENLEHLVSFKGKLLTLFDENSNLPNLKDVHGDLDLSYLENVPNLLSLESVTGKIYISESASVEMMSMVENLTTKIRKSIEYV